MNQSRDRAAFEAWARLSSSPQPAGGAPEGRNIIKVERTSDQSVSVTLASCRAASAFERAVTPKEGES